MPKGPQKRDQIVIYHSRAKMGLMAFGSLLFVVAAAFMAYVGLQRFLCIVPRDLEAFLNRQPRWKRRLMRSNVSLVGAPMTISTVALPMSLEELQKQIKTYMGMHRSQIEMW